MKRTTRKHVIPWRIVAAIVLPLLAAGCVSTTAGITPSNIPLEGKKYSVLGTASATETWVSLDLGIVGFPLGEPPVDLAVARVIDKKGGDALINIRYSTDRIVVLFVIIINRFHIKADVVRVEPDKAPEAPKKR